MRYFVEITNEADKTRTAVELAAINSRYLTEAFVSQVVDTLYLLTDSMDFSDANESGWEALILLCYRVWEPSHRALLLWTLKTLTFELKTYAIIERFARMLFSILRPEPELEEASRLLLDLGGVEVIDIAVLDTDGYTILHQAAIWHTHGQVSLALSKGPNLHPLGFNSEFSPRGETSTSLAMYLSPSFAQWRIDLIMNEVDLEKFVESEMKQNHFVHPGWDKQSLSDLFAYTHDDLDVDLRGVFTCNDCNRCIDYIKVQPYWRHLLERIKQGFDPETPSLDDSDTCEEWEAEAESRLELESERQVESDEDPHGYPATISIRFECIYAEHEVVCMDCWQYYTRTGVRGPPRSWKRRFAYDVYRNKSSDDSSEDEYSPYHIHS